ncbi:MAG: DMT family transporter [Spirochaetales bacterium]|nr:DMT family transporter [Spirochaetales bacterium]
MILGYICAFGVVALWSFTPVMVKIALQFIDPFTLSFLRLIQGLALVVLLHRIRTGSFRKMYRFEPWIILGGFGIAVNYVLFVVALNFTTASMGGLVIQFQFVTLAALAWIVLKEPFHIRKLAAVLVIVSGVSLVFFYRQAASELIHPEYVFGNVCMLIAGLGWGVYALSGKAVSHRKTNFEMLIPMFSMAALVSLAASLIGFEYRAPITWQGITSIIILGTGVTGIGFLFLSTSLRRLNASLVGGITSVTPLFNILVSHRILGEPLSLTLVIGAVICIAGLVALILSDRYIKKEFSVKSK